MIYDLMKYRDDVDLISVRICQFTTLVLSTASLVPFFNMALSTPLLLTFPERNYWAGRNAEVM
jgi:hypothetical protein